ncbi:RNA-binding S4 domain-containing protein [Tepidibacter aestuarii]|uniref:RNA-binding S4 domain-containing protein n=1 Tax=Tepidibacter aestuarii TaxID=2925782 RepID=UPI0020BFEAAD|nr:RNA-binding S4 domain-containing protein [Tepidibacter aestuarii]CAH2215119.1 ribosomal quality control associated RNA P-site tRNA binding protein involved in 50S recycling; heat shock protein [Tepidibacter aestuarii]
MRLDKYLKVSRLIKRRTVAKEACDKGIISINDKVAKSSTVVSVGDIIKIRFGERVTTVKVACIKEHVLKNDAKEMYEVIE